METIVAPVAGKNYKLHMIPAYYAQMFLDAKEPGEFSDDEVMFLMKHVSIDGVFLDCESAIDKYVDDWMVLTELVSMVYNVNFGFMSGWRFWRVPSSDGFVSSEPRQLSAFCHSIITNKYATLVQLKTCVSLKDAFEMHDSIMTKAMNEYRYSKMKGTQ